MMMKVSLETRKKSLCRRDGVLTGFVRVVVIGSLLFLRWRRLLAGRRGSERGGLPPLLSHSGGSLLVCRSWVKSCICSMRTCKYIQSSEPAEDDATADALFLSCSLSKDWRPAFAHPAEPSRPMLYVVWSSGLVPSSSSPLGCPDQHPHGKPHPWLVWGPHVDNQHGFVALLITISTIELISAHSTHIEDVQINHTRLLILNTEYFSLLLILEICFYSKALTYTVGTMPLNKNVLQQSTATKDCEL